VDLRSISKEEGGDRDFENLSYIEAFENHKLAEMKGIEGAIVGKALYAGAFTLEEALALTKGAK